MVINYMREGMAWCWSIFRRRPAGLSSSSSFLALPPRGCLYIDTFTIFKCRKLCAMGTTIARRLDAFLSSISKHYPFRYRETTTSTSTYNYNNNNNRSAGDRQIYHYNMTKSRPLSLQVVDLKVRMCCEGCERVVKNAILKLRGVDSVEVDLDMWRVTVTGYVDRSKVLKAVRRSGKKAEFWPNPDLPRYFTTSSDYFYREETFGESYNYWRHGYNGDTHGHVPVTQRGDDRVSNIFNDDDVNACAVM